MRLYLAIAGVAGLLTVGGGAFWAWTERGNQIEALEQAVRDRDAVIIALRKNMKDLIRDQINDDTIDAVPNSGLGEFGAPWLCDAGAC